ncbi:MAG: SDR family oxidoreductase [Kiritimatiellae bacterium]|jgi:glucose 1-dehydrogenase|nr:SDR family oxidoreductase [Kiritimatiellia bacterium]
MTHTPDFDLSGKHALVTGSSRGIGRSIALALADAGADVAIHAAGSLEKAEAVAEEIRGMGRQSAVIMADLASGDAPRTIFDGVVDAFGSLDILVSNASVQLPENWSGVSRDHFEQQVTVNWRSAFELIQLCLPPMMERGWGRILTIGSVQEARPHPEMVIYAATKSAQTSMVRNLAKQVAHQGVNINNLAPGVIGTDRSLDRLKDAEYAKLVRSKIPADRIGQPEDCAGTALLLCINAGQYITGQNFYVDGGLSL